MKNGYISSEVVHADGLTWREQEVLILLADRMTNREIADQLHLAESTVKDYVGRILSKLHVKNRRQAVERAKDLGLLDLEVTTRVSLPINLPAESTPFVGRKDELDQIRQHLVKTRLLTLTGPGGIGKSRLALRTALELIEDFEDGIFYVSLAPISSEEHIIQTIAESLKFPLATHEEPLHQLLRYLRHKQLLLVMDNFEHLLQGAEIVSEILQAAPGVKILTTSREKLNLLSETTFIIRGMVLPGEVWSEDLERYDAITLFVQSANKVCPGFAPVQTGLDQIASICQIVQGMPLAIELAAAWLQILNLEEILAELGKGLDILTTDVRDAPERHRSIRSVFDHSWSLLEHTEQETFMLLSVFRSGFTREAARQVSGASLQQLMGLVNKSFLSHDPDSGRLEVHELLRQYAQEKLQENPQTCLSAQEAHAAFFAEFMLERWQRLKGDRQQIALIEIETDIENVRTAWRYYLDQNNSPQTLKFIKGLWMVCWIRGWNLVGMQLFAEAARAQIEIESEQDAVLQAYAMAFQGYFMAWLDLSEQGYQLTKASVEILEGINYPEALVFAIDSLLINCYFQNRLTEQIEVTQKMLNLAEEIGDKWLIAFTFFAGGMAAMLAEDYPEARRVAESQLNLCEEIGDVIGSTLPLIVLGHAALAQGEYERARGYYQRCKKISQVTGFLYAFQTSSKYLGKVDISLGKITEAEKNLQQCLLMTVEIGFIRDKINLVYEYARLRVIQGDPVGAVELLGFVVQDPISKQSRLFEGRIRDSAEELLAKLEAEMNKGAYLAALERGQEMELEVVVADLVGRNHPR
jgi:predicted ATPase/DNA-binding CsgD family transcriptional regulator